MIRVRVPATTANLGPGFDCMGLALDLWNTFELRVGGDTCEVVSYGEGADRLATGPDNLIVTTMQEELARLGQHAVSNFSIFAHNTVPCGSGLGSSSTATVAGVVFAHAVAAERRGKDPAELDREAILSSSIAVEGHGDNVAPALLGGFVIVMPDADGVISMRLPHVPIKTVVCVPDFAFMTSEARAALPPSYGRQDAIFNIGRAMLVAEALRSGNDEVLARAMDDRIHEPYRLPLIPGAADAKACAVEQGAVCAALSGAGPGVIAFARYSYDRIGRAMKDAFASSGLESRYFILDVASEGTSVARLPV